MSAGYTPAGRARQAAPVILHGRRLLLARAALAVVAILVVALFIRAVPLEFMAAQVVCTGRDCRAPLTQAPLTPDMVRQLQALGLIVKVVVLPNNSPSDTVVYQDPPADTPVHQGDRVTIYVTSP